jgi:hypothetical protein
VLRRLTFDRTVGVDLRGVFVVSRAFAPAPRGVLVNAVAPGPIETPTVAGLSEAWKAAKRAELPVGRFGVAEEVAPTIVMLPAPTPARRGAAAARPRRRGGRRRSEARRRGLERAGGAGRGIDRGRRGS